MGFLNPNNWFAGQNDPTSYGKMTGQSAAPGTLAYEGVTPNSGQNSLEQYLRSLQNYGGQQSQNFMNTGQGLLSSGTNAVQAPMSYYSSLLSGNPASMSQAIQPEVSAIKGQFGNLRNQADQFAPMGGGRSSLMANMPYQMQGQIGNLLAQVRPMAAQQLGLLGQGQQQMGISTSNLGANMLNQILSALYTGRGQDVGETGQNKDLTGSLSRDLTAGLVGAYGKP